MDIELAATHEAGHAVMQWFTGLEVGELVMTVKDGNASAPSARCPRIPLPTLSDLRKRLLVLLAGNTATLERWPTSWNDRNDWLDVISALKEHLELEQLAWVLIEGKTAIERFMKSREPHSPEVDKRKTDNPEANAVFQDALAHCRAIIADPLFKKGIVDLAAAFIAAPVGENGLTRLEGPEAAAICERGIGPEFKAANPWSAWIAGES